MDKINLRDKLARFAEHWSPKVVGELNGQQVKLVRFRGPFVWHHHEGEDGLFLVVPRGSSTARWPRRRPTSCCSSRPRRSTPAMSGTSGRSRTWRGFDDSTTRYAGIPLHRHGELRARLCQFADPSGNAYALFQRRYH